MAITEIAVNIQFFKTTYNMHIPKLSKKTPVISVEILVYSN